MCIVLYSGLCVCVIFIIILFVKHNRNRSVHLPYKYTQHTHQNSVGSYVIERPLSQKSSILFLIFTFSQSYAPTLFRPKCPVFCRNRSLLSAVKWMVIKLIRENNVINKYIVCMKMPLSSRKYIWNVTGQLMV